MRLTRDEIVDRMCKLQHEVVEHLLGSDEPNDCFCFNPANGGRTTTDFRSSGDAIEYIEQVVRAHLKKDAELKRTWLDKLKEQLRSAVDRAIANAGNG